VDAHARSIGAVNTVKNESGFLRGFNTDGPGALQALRDSNAEPRDKAVVILGAGGAAKAIAFTIAPLAATLTIANRTLEKAEALAASLQKTHGRQVQCLSLASKELGEAIRNADILINTTAVGMHPHVENTPVPRGFLHSNLTVFDAVYNPRETRLLKEAREIGAKTIGGIGMLVHQGAKAFELWTNRKAPVDVMLKALEAAM